MNEPVWTDPEGRAGAPDKNGFPWYSVLWRVLRPLLVGLCALLVTAGLVMGLWNGIERTYFAAVDASDPTEITFQIKSGASLTRVANDLQAAGLIRSSSVFKYYADFLGYGQKIQSGDYVLTRAQSLPEIADKLTTGDGNPIVRNITVIPGWTVRDIASYLVSVGQLDDADPFLALCRTGTDFREYYYVSDVLATATAASRLYKLEGYLMPDTYEVYTSAGAADIIRKLLSQTQAVFTDSMLTRAEEIGMSMDQVLTLASIIEKEARNEDFARVSAVFHNRLDLGMSLGSDATVKYVSGVTRLSLSNEDLGYASPYNTYLYRGLPPGPICSPSAAAITAALYPDEVFLQEQYLYFCTKEPGSGSLAFARTLEEHNRNVAVYSPLWQAYDREQAEKTDP